jgi:hypothetical protein
MLFSTIAPRPGSMLLMRPEMQFGRIVFSTFCPRATFRTAWVIRDRIYSRSGHACYTPIATDFCSSAKCRDVPLPEYANRC